MKQLATAHGRWMEALCTARRLLSKPGKWSRSTMSLSRNGMPCNVGEATRYSLTGALEWALDDPNELYALCQYICRELGMKGNLHDWHRRLETGGEVVVLADVIRLLDKAIRATERRIENHER
jgi:hypothetical protein